MGIGTDFLKDKQVKIVRFTSIGFELYFLSCNVPVQVKNLDVGTMNETQNKQIGLSDKMRQ